jgi:hypothetical protein
MDGKHFWEIHVVFLHIFKLNKFISIWLWISQKDYICFDFVPRHQNVIRFRKGLAMIKDDFSTVCSWVQFPNKDEWKYDLMLGNVG